MATLIFILLAFSAGCGLSIQAGVNAQLGNQADNHLLWAALASFMVGTIFLVPFTLLSGTGWPALSQLSAVRWWAWAGGVIGALYVISTIVIAPRLGAAVFFSCLIAGQVITSLLLDRYGLIGFQQHRLTPMRMLGGLLVIGGAILVRRF